MKIFDCVTFFNEHDLFDIRYELLKKKIDYFIVIEGAKTFDGKKKDFCFKYEKYDKDKIRYIKIHDFDQNVSLNSFPEYYDDLSKNRMLDGLFGANYNDIVLISDCDEIPHPNTIEKIKRIENSKVGICYQNMVCLDYKHFVKTNWFWFYKWPGTKFMRFKDLVIPKSLKWFHQPRLYDLRNFFKYNILIDKGFHFTWIGNLEKIINKYEAGKNVHDNYISKNNEVKISNREIKEIYDLYERGEKFSFPFIGYEIIKDDPKRKYDKLIYKLLKDKSLL